MIAAVRKSCSTFGADSLLKSEETLNAATHARPRSYQLQPSGPGKVPDDGKAHREIIVLRGNTNIGGEIWCEQIKSARGAAKVIAAFFESFDNDDAISVSLIHFLERFCHAQRRHD